MDDEDAKKPLDPLDLRRAFGTFATGVTIITTVDEAGEVYGFTANSFSSVSLDPPLLLVNIAKSAYGLKVFGNAEGFAVNILAENQRELSNTFATKGTDKFAGSSWSSKFTGSPVFDGVIAWFDCESFQQVDAGDHLILIGKVLEYDYNSDAPLGFCRGAYVSYGLSPQMLQLVSSTGSLRVGAVVEVKGNILLETDPDSDEVRIPVADNVGDIHSPDSLLGKLASTGLEAKLPFLYAAYHHGDTRFIYYRGEVLSMKGINESPHLHFFAFDAIPWDAIHDTAVTSMLKRYITERSMGNYSVYLGGHVSGEVYPVKTGD